MWSGGGVLLLESLDDLCPETIIVVLEVLVPRTVPSISTRGGIKKLGMLGVGLMSVGSFKHITPLST